MNRKGRYKSWARASQKSRMSTFPRAGWGDTRVVASCQAMSEIIFEVKEDEVDGGYTAHALGYGIHTQGDTLDELRTMVRDAVACYFEGRQDAPAIIRLHFVRDEVLIQ
jgi:predicted RNase H-like HicB family nuclease